MLDRFALILLDEKQPIYINAVELFEFQCRVYGIPQTTARGFAVLAVLQELGSSKASDDKIVHLVRQFCCSPAFSLSNLERIPLILEHIHREQNSLRTLSR